MAVISINYDGETQKSYKNTEIEYGEKLENIKLFKSEDFVKDWYNKHDLNEFIIKELLETEYHISYSSSVDQFLLCGNKYESVHLVNIQGNEWELIRIKNLKPMQTGLEFFIETDSDITWKKMQEKYGKNLSHGKEEK